MFFFSKIPVSVFIKNPIKKRNVLHFVLFFVILVSFAPIVESNGITTTDRFGLHYIYPSAGRVFESHWDQGGARTLQLFQRDPIDSDLIVRGENALVVIDGNGIAKMKGLNSSIDASPRIYIYDEQKLKTWQNTEMTGCMMRVSENTQVSTAGLVMVSRSEHQDVDLDLANGKGYAGRIAYDGKIEFVKEVIHGSVYAYSEAWYYPWETLNDQFPYNQWICSKLVTYNLPDGTVMLELYLDTTGGFNGGNWKKIDQFIDNGSWYGSIFFDPATSVYLRNDGLGEARWKNFSVREIVPPVCQIPISVDWVVSKNCFLTSNVTIPKSMTVQNNSLVIIPAGTSLSIPSGHNIIIKNGSGVLIKSGGSLHVNS